MVQDNTTPLVTAVVPVYNHERYVVDSIRSIIGQSYPNIELIIINDGSKDRSHEMILSVVEECERRFSRFEYIGRENRGLSATLNQALDLAKGEYFSPFASDDVMLPNKFGRLVEALESKDEKYAAAFGDALMIDEQGLPAFLDKNGKLQGVKNNKTYDTLMKFTCRQRDLDCKTEFGTYSTILKANYLPAPSNILKTTCLKEVGGWTSGNVLEDWEMWLKLSKRYSMLFVDEAVALYRVHGQNSWDTMRQHMMSSTMRLLARERGYCADVNLMREWNDAFYGQLYWLLRYGGFPLKERVSELMSAQPVSFILFLLREKLKMISRRSTGSK